MWIYSQSSGEITHDGLHIGTGYSGIGAGKNNPKAEALQGVGPIPTGIYTIGAPYTHQVLGPVTMNLDPVQGTVEFGRSDFRIHGDSTEHPGAASHGCIVLPPACRRAIAASPDRKLEVTE